MATAKIKRDICLHKGNAGDDQGKEQSFHAPTDQWLLENLVQFCVSQLKRNISEIISKDRRVNGVEIMLEKNVWKTKKP